ncbi:hypothetical protein P9112_007337 [Eukaryota sp. TZLM1-RC]
MAESPVASCSFDEEDEQLYSSQFLRDLDMSHSSHNHKSKDVTSHSVSDTEDAHAFASKLLKDLPVPPAISSSGRKSRPQSADQSDFNRRPSKSMEPERRFDKRSHSVSFDENLYRSSRLSLPSPIKRPTHASSPSLKSTKLVENAAPPGFFTAAFVENLQKQHKERLASSIESANRILQTKETEVKRLQDQLTQAQQDHSSKEEVIKGEVAELRRLFDKQVAQVKSEAEKEKLELYEQLERQREHSRQEILENSCKFEGDIDDIKAEHDRSIASLKSSFQEERQAWLREKEDLQGEWETEMEKVEEEHAEEVKGLKEELAKMGECNSQLREDLCSLSLEKGNDILELQSKIDDYQRNQEVMEEKIRSIVNRHRNELQSRDNQWTETVNNLKRSLEKERICSSQAISALQQRVRDFDSALKDAQTTHKTAIAQASAEVSKLSDALSKAREAVETHKAVANDASSEVCRLEQEVNVLRSELEAVEYEKRRIKESEGALRHEVDRYQSFMGYRSR